MSHLIDQIAVLEAETFEVVDLIPNDDLQAASTSTTSSACSTTSTCSCSTSSCCGTTSCSCASTSSCA
ncbi:hypothetical protein LX16_1095 [Stackebrandtia albiflava]|uniref:Thiazolylpeptide-type bacteriocin n=1 Tax=Stackebrandtia albiflava TaxID=406432 RepID=A0A562VC03_9ACTN|nr:hypothetical protein LX16_1095 [Stackebrandtia albiflava]